MSKSRTEKASERRGFVAGFAVACVMLHRDHHEDAYAEMLIKAAGISVADLEASGVDADDVTLLKPYVIS